MSPPQTRSSRWEKLTLDSVLLPENVVVVVVNVVVVVVGLFKAELS